MKSNSTNYHSLTPEMFLYNVLTVDNRAYKMLYSIKVFTQVKCLIKITFLLSVENRICLIKR